MPGAWELARPNVLVATLTRETVSMKWAAAYRRLTLPPNSAEALLSGMPFDHARNQACMNALANGFEWIFFLDDDVVCPPDTIHRLLGHGKDIVSGLYYRRAPPLVPVMLKYKPDGKNAEWITGWNPPGAVIDVDLVGAGCLLIHRRVLERMYPDWQNWTPPAGPIEEAIRLGVASFFSTPRPWFVWELDKNLPEPRHSEDFSFCREAKRRFGFGIFVDTSIQCEHIGYASSGAAGYQPASL